MTLTIRPLRSDVEAVALRALRAAANRVAPDHPGCWDPFDDKVILIGAYDEDQLVGSVRVHHPECGPVQRYYRPLLAAAPAEWPPEEGYVEASRFCIHPDRQRRGLLWPLAAAMVVFASSFERRYLLSGAERSLHPAWAEVGFRTTGWRYDSMSLSPGDREIILLDIQRVLYGMDTSPRMNHALDDARGLTIR